MVRKLRASVDLAALVESYLLSCRADGKSVQTVRWYEGKLRGWMDWINEQLIPLEPDMIQPKVIAAFIVALRERKSWEIHATVPTLDRPISGYTVKGYVQVIKGFFTWLVREGHIADHPVAHLRMPKVPKHVVQVLTPEQQRHMLAVADSKTVEGVKYRAIIALLLDTGIRVGELVGLSMPDVDSRMGILLVRGKGNKERLVPYGAQTAKLLARWMLAREQAITGEQPALFVTQYSERITRHAVEEQVRRYATKAGIPQRVYPHLLRHTFAVSFLRAGGNAFTLQQLLGHTSLETVKLYVHLAESDVTEAYRRSSPVDHL